VKGFGQAFFARSVRGTLTWAHGYRLGLARAFGMSDVPPSERFKAGGSNSLRGFATDSILPPDPIPLGGFALVVMNQELRYRHPIGIGAVAFWDAGNVFQRIEDLSFDLRHSLGFGLRWDSPVGLLRLDLGFPLGRREGEDAHQLFFSLGQAF
jgi:outer membrane translocation and assembly module TamA